MFKSCASYLAFHAQAPLDLGEEDCYACACYSGTHEISLHTVQAMFARIKDFQSMWTPIFYGPGTHPYTEGIQ
jgi:hypothetical protein